MRPGLCILLYIKSKKKGQKNGLKCIKNNIKALVLPFLVHIWNPIHKISNRRQKNYVLFDILLFSVRLLLYFAIFRKIANFSVSCFFTSIKRGSRYLKNGCFDWADFLTQDSSHPYAQNKPWNKSKNLKKKSYGIFTLGTRRNFISKNYFFNISVKNQNIPYSMAHFVQKGDKNLV